MAFKIPDNITWKVLKSGTVLLNITSGNYYTLNETASHIWDNIVTQKDRHEIILSLCELYDCSRDQAETDVEDTFSFFTREGLLE